MMFIIDGTAGTNIPQFLEKLRETTIGHIIIPYHDWRSNHACTQTATHNHPEGIIYIRVMPEIAYKRLQANYHEPITQEKIDHIYHEKEQFFIKGKDNPKEIENLPLLVLNGNIDFQNDFAQFYNHLFYIKKFINEIEKRKAVALGTYKEKPQRRCC